MTKEVVAKYNSNPEPSFLSSHQTSILIRLPNKSLKDPFAPAPELTGTIVQLAMNRWTSSFFD